MAGWENVADLIEVTSHFPDEGVCFLEAVAKAESSVANALAE